MSEISTQNQFSKYAKEYGKYNIIQQIVSKALVRDIQNQPQHILELGCGSGQIFRYINWDFKSYIAIDSSEEMCKLHPKSANLQVKCLNFDDDTFYKYIDGKRYDIIISSSALQWSQNISRLVKSFTCISDVLNVALFTSNTFKTIYDITKQKSPILTLETIKEVFSKYYKCEFEVFTYKLEFDNKKEMFDYIKHSGVSGKSSLSYSQAKHLYTNYKLNYLEFEVVFIKASKKD